MSGTPSLKRAYNLGLKAVPNFEGLSPEIIEYYEQHLDEIPLALTRGFVIIEKVNEPVEVIKPPALKPLLSIVATTHLGATNSKKTSKCFTGQPWSYRDGDFDNWLQKDQPNADTGVISTLAVSRTWLFAEAARALPGVEQTVDIAALGRSLIACGYTMTLVQAEEMVETTERGEKTGMRTNRYGNFFFVETGNPNDPVSVGFVHRDRRVWDASLGRLGRRWYADNRLLVRNLDASKLGL